MSAASRRACLTIVCVISSQNLSRSEMRRGSAAEAGTAKAGMAAKIILTGADLITPPQNCSDLPSDRSCKPPTLVPRRSDFDLLNWGVSVAWAGVVDQRAF